MDHSHHHQHLPPLVPTAHAHHKETMHHAGHDRHAGHHNGDFLKRFWICLILTIPVLALSHMIQQWIGVNFKFTSYNYLLLVLGCIIYFGRIFKTDSAGQNPLLVHLFDSTNGSVPTGTLFQASNGEIYGITSEGGYQQPFSKAGC